ncbi:SGNH/GDSL hydrolase family protein [Paenibacillus soyae]|uniref:SGNH/GDSL hydrolase family protein n=1 Tax=Paenibacillus soyae TaxID=2969249 RepID=A0A9X2SAE6_9BACL|nr:SGNH/GDSL hydrolase family protein [Paenibacillus soyae]MCR2805955.1 SGNH/GDSL hydrolase family protein [Paenibacillus soyae]
MAGKGKTILFQGDSITDAGRPREEGSSSLGQGYVNLIAGKLGYELAESRHRFVNRGIGGNRVSDLYARWNEDAIHLRPDAISILIGVNDAWRIVRKLPEGATDRFERAYRHLLDETKEILPDAGLILCEPFLLQAGIAVEGWEEWRSHLDGYRRIVSTLAEQYGAVFVALQEPFDQAALRTNPSYWLRDGVHPTAAGHELIAREWIGAVQRSPLALS